jgi:cytochrome P450
MNQAGATRSIADLPGPRGFPLLGNAHRVRADRLHSVSEEWCERYGPMFRFDLGPRRIVAIGDQEAINTILRERPEGYRRWRELKAILAGLGNDGVFSAEGEDWKRQRRLAVTALNSNHLHRYFHIIHTATERLYRRLKEAARDGRALDIAGELTSFSVDVTSALAFGHDLNTLERRDNELQGHIQTLFETTGRRVVAPFAYWRWVKLPADRAAERSMTAIHAAVRGFIAQARKRMLERPELLQAPENFLESMLAAQETEGTFTDEEIIWNTITFLSAGEDTTAHTIAWTLWFLSVRPEIQSRWAREAQAVLGEQPYPAGHEIVESFDYGEAVLREAMRLKSVAPILAFEPIADTTIAGTHIPAGTRLLLLTRQTGLHKGGGGEYEPERWLHDSELPAPDQKSFLAFGAGPRFCPGRNLAFLESKTAMAMIARNFEVELDESRGPVKEQLSFTMVPHGLHLRLRERVAGSPMPMGAGA